MAVFLYQPAVPSVLVAFLSTVYHCGKFKSGLSNRPEKLVRFMAVRVEYDRSNRVCI